MNDKDLSVIAPEIPMLPDIMKSAIPIAIPQMSFSDGIITNYFGNVKREQIAKSKQLEAEIAQHTLTETKARLDTVQELITYGARIKEAFEIFEQNKELRKIGLETAKAGLVEVQLKNQLLHTEVKIAEIELKVKIKEMEELSGTSKTEDRDN